jgi:hypothetical protein
MARATKMSVVSTGLTVSSERCRSFLALQEYIAVGSGEKSAMHEMTRNSLVSEIFHLILLNL